MRLRSLVCVSLAALSLSSAAAAGVVVVDSVAPDALQLGIDSTLDGDTVLVHPGSFGPVSIAGKGLTVVANSPNTVQVESLTISALSAAQTCAITSVRERSRPWAMVSPARERMRPSSAAMRVPARPAPGRPAGE